MIFYFSSSIGEVSNLHFALFITIIIIPSIINLRHIKGVIFHIAFPMLLLLMLVFTDFSIFPPIQQIYPEQIAFYGKVNTLIMFMVLPWLVFFLIKSYGRVFKDLIVSEQKLQVQNTALKKANEELDRFVYSVSHDLRAPVASMMGLISLSKSETDIDKLQHYESLKEQSILKLDQFIGEITDYARNGRLPLQPKPYSGKRILTSITKDYEHLPQFKDISININISQKDDFVSDKTA